MNKKFIVIGLGDFGWNVATSLAESGAEVIAVDKNMDIIEDIKDKVTYAVRFNSTEERPLKQLGVDDVDAVIVSIGTNFENTLLTSVLLLQMKVKKVIARASSRIQETILQKLGVHQVINPEREIAKRVARNLIHEEVIDSVPLGEDYNIVQLKAPNFIVGKSLQELDLRIKFNVNLITLKRFTEIIQEDTKEKTIKERIYGVPTASTVFEKDDILVILGKEKDIKNFVEA